MAVSGEAGVAARRRAGAPARPPRSGSMLAWRLASIGLFCLAWEIAGRIPINPAFPPFGETFVAFVAMVADGSLPLAYASTLQPLAIGVVVSATLGVALGVAMGLRPSRRVARGADLHRAAGRARRGADPARHLRLRHRAHGQDARRLPPGAAGDRAQRLQGRAERQPLAPRHVPLVPRHAPAADRQDRAAGRGAADLRRACASASRPASSASSSPSS